MQVYEAEFYPVEEKEGKKLPIFKIGAVILCVILFVILSVRYIGWTKNNQEAELLSLVNRWNSVDAADFKLRLQDIGGGFRADKRCTAELEKLLSDCRAEGGRPEIIAAYRSGEEQQKVYEDEIRRREILGMSRPQAEKMVADKVDVPGRSEHELGLAFDIAEDRRDTSPDCRTISWLMENSWRYGFILRYPQGSESVAGRAFSPGHYRYVGKEAAEQMKETGLCLEDYIGMFYSNQANVIVEK